MLRYLAAILCMFLLSASALHAADAVTKSRALAATGKDKQAIALLQLEITKQLKSAERQAQLHAELAQRWLVRGDLASTEKSVSAALKLAPADPLAHWIQAEVLREQGKLKQAEAAYKWHFDEYNAREFDDAESLFWCAKGIGQYVRWRRLHDAYGTLVNDVYPQVLKLNPQDWRVRLEMGQLFLEKYNLAEADRQFVAGLKINPHAAQLHAARAKLFLLTYDLDAAQASLRVAREINPRLLAVQQLEADLHFANFRPRAAVDVLHKALEIRPHDEATLGRLAAAYLAIDGAENSQAPARFDRLELNLRERNSQPGRFYAQLASTLDQLRQYPTAAMYWKNTIKIMPQHPYAQGQLGMIQMRLGEEASARKTLEQAFKDDPFNVRVKNTLAVLDVLESYETIETPHFLIRFDPKQNAVLARAAADYLEHEVFGAVTKQLGYTPKEKTLIEIFSKAKNTTGHGWFSARMVGLPSVGTVGACVGKMLAIASPNEMQQKFNWAQVLKHEFVHVVNLQQTNFNIPHWFTEALAVHNEGYPRPPAWNRLLATRLAEGRLFDLYSINFGFIRPESDEQWSLAYCQAELYAQFMLAEFGDDALAKLLTAYADRLESAQAIEREFKITQKEFEQRYIKYVRQAVAELPKSVAVKSRSFAELQKAAANNLDDVDVAAQMALAFVRRKSYVDARRWADRAMKIEPKHQLAAYVRARLHLVVGEDAEAANLLEVCLDREQPQPNALALLAGLKLRLRKYDEAAQLYSLGAKHAPDEIKWPKSLAVVYLQAGDTEKLAAMLEQIALTEPDNYGSRKKLAQIYHDKSDHAATVRWATEAIHVNVLDAASHRLRGQALSKLGHKSRAIESLRLTLLLNPTDRESQRLLDALQKS
jgi:Tfp pilus assembly protein PilF